MILLKSVRLVNWYGFNYIAVPIGYFSLIAGKNGNGKSVLLDAIKYALYGDTVFNKSTENKGSRTLSSYTRGLLDATAGTYMRPADQFPNVYTHIVLEMFEEEMRRSFVLGTVIETNSANGFNTNRYIIENSRLSDVDHVYEENGLTIPYDGIELQKKYSFKMLDAMDGIAKFMQRTGLRLNGQQIVPFRRKLRSIMSYDPDAKIDQFIRESVLEEKKVDFSKLVEAKNNIEILNTTFEKIDAEIKELEEILALFDGLQNAKNIIIADDVKIAYKKLLGIRRDIDEAIKSIDQAERQLDEDDKRLVVIQKQEKDIRGRLKKVEDSLDAMDCTKAIRAAEEQVEQLTSRKEILNTERKNLEAFQTKISELINWFYEKDIPVNNQSILSSLTANEYTAVQKASGIDVFSVQIQNIRDDLLAAITRLQDETKKNQAMQVQQQRLIDDCNDKKTTFSEIPDYVALKDEISKAFANRHIRSEAKFACEYVIALKDEGWRNAIESFLGKRRYTILVDPEYYDIADDVLNESPHRYAHLFNTKLLMKKKLSPEEDSVVRYIEVKNSVAKQYFEYQLGRMHAVTKEQVRNFENAISKEGRVSVAMDSYFLQFDRIRFYCLGQETIELNRIRAEKKLQALVNEGKMLRERVHEQIQKKEYLETAQKHFDNYNYDACQMYEDILLKYGAASKELEHLKQAQQNNMEYLEMNQLYTKYKGELDANGRERGKVQESQVKMRTQLEVNQEKEEVKTAELEKYNGIMNEYQIQNYDVCKRAIESYDKYIANGKAGAGGTLKDRERAERNLREAGNDLIGAQSAYNARRNAESRLPTGDNQRFAYEIRKTQIWMDDLQEIKEKLREQTRRYEEIFKNEFVLTVLKSCESAKDDLKLINAELSRLKFKSKYEFDVKYAKDGSDYEKILEYAKYLKEREDLGANPDQMILQSLTTFTDDKGMALEKEIRKIINRIIDSNDKEQIEKYADYRNYMVYEILLTNDVLNKAKLSKQSGFNSGAEVQIPYMLILLSALLMIYNDKINSTRLVFIDEPFAKMDPSNVKIMLDFMKKQKLQMIFCSPDKTELIGDECNVILPVLRTRADLMEIGIVEMHEECSL
ncbi:SbcC/MukB-like Walker B domain-containing protein [Ruminiclostridium cellobioparum]|uniref:SbcC/MukB-like Walker B domain-containing protein n=1 Tax=Ruminiclostridium cellobioparum TaxID=29355 RepID=UPI000488C90E|nr:SbcC/MukB-like Walker B domain-containing protein [Ruminiclostridium cellobioparum]